MVSVNGEDSLETDCYDKILKFFISCQEESRDRKEIWKSTTLITLMKQLARTKNKKLTKNAIILMITLFEDIPPDIYNNRGININRLSENDRESVLSSLKEEFLPN